MPLVSVLIPAYAQARFLSDAVKSVQAQRFKDWEGIIVASDDECLKAAERATADDNRFRVLWHPPTGVGDARNVAVRHSSGKYLFPLDADDMIGPWCLSQATSAIDSKARYAIAHSDVHAFAGTTYEPPRMPETMFVWAPTWTKFAMLEQNCLPYAALHTFELWEHAGGWDRALIGFEDWAYWIACVRPGPVVTHVPGPNFYHRRWGASRSADLDRWGPLWRAMIRTRFPDLYPASRDDRVTIANAGAGMLERLKRQLAFFPTNKPLQEWIGLIEGAVVP